MDKFVIRTQRKLCVKKPSKAESSKRSREEVDLNDLPADPMERRRISDYNPNDREKVRRAYLLRGPHQPTGHKFPSKVIGRKKRKFVAKWFTLYKPWLEYSVKGDAAYCLYCYLCADDVDESDDTSFAKGGFRNWKKPEKFRIHIGGVNSSHNQCRRKCEDLMNQDQHIEHSFHKQSSKMKIEYEMRLLATIDCIRWCLHQGISFRAHDESDDSINMGNFKEGKRYTLVRLAELYPSDFSELDRVYLDDELETFLFDMKSNPKFVQLKGIARLASKLVKEKKHIIYPLVYRLINLVLVLPVSTASVERSFSAMKIVKTRLRNKIGDEWMNDCLVTYIEKKVFESVSNDLIMQRFQKMTKRRHQLPNKSK